MVLVGISYRTTLRVEFNLRPNFSASKGIYISEIIHGNHSLLEILRWITLMSVSFNKNDVTQAKNVYKLWLPWFISVLIGKNIVDFEAQSSMGNALKIHLAVFLYRQNPIGYCVTFSNLMVFDRGNLNKWNAKTNLKINQ